MTVYVDRFIVNYGGMWNDGGHLLGSDLDELHEFAQSIGLKRQWFQDETFPHYDVTRNKRYAAIRAGAKKLKRGEFPDDLLVKRHDGTYEKYSDRLERLNAPNS